MQDTERKRLLIDDYAIPSVQESDNIAIILINRKNPHSGTLRALINFCKATKYKDRVIIALYNCTDYVYNVIKNQVNNIKIIKASSLKILHSELIKNNVKLVIGDDALSRMHIMNKLKSLGYKTLIYAQIMYGVQSLLTSISENSNLLRFIKSLLWPLARERYSRAISKHDILVSNSKSMAMFLYTFYGLSTVGYSYPLVDTNIFKPYGKNHYEHILVYASRPGIDTPRTLIRRIIRQILKHSDMKIVVLAEKEAKFLLLDKELLGDESSRRIKILGHIKNDLKLAELYSKSYIVVAPQPLESFGYVPVEAMACGAPPLTFGLFGPSETVIHGKTGWLAYNDKDLLGQLNNILRNGYDKKIRSNAVQHVRRLFSVP